MLAEHPYVLGRLRKEILDKVGSSRRPTLDDVRELKYLRAVINGVLLCFFCVRASPNGMIYDRDTSTVPTCVSTFRYFIALSNGRSSTIACSQTMELENHKQRDPLALERS
jgi:hypothetical protein